MVCFSFTGQALSHYNHLMNKEIFLSLVIPTYNEAKRLPITLSEIRPWLDDQGFVYEVLLMDGKSTDETEAYCRQLRESWPEIEFVPQTERRGKGYCVKVGCLRGRGKHILVMDADHPTPISTLALMVPHTKNYDMIVGVRAFCGEEGASGRGRRIIGLAQQLLAHIVVFQQSVADSQCGFKLFSNACAKKLFSRSVIEGGMYDVELFFIAHRHKIGIYSMPVTWVNKEGSTINLIRCILFDPFSLFYIRWMGLLGHYN